MPINKKGGKKTKRGKNQRAPRSLVIKDHNTLYAKVLANVGNGLLHLKIISDEWDGTECRGHIRGAVRRAKFNKDEIVLIGIRTFSSNTNDKILEADIVYKYYPDQVQELVRRGEILQQISYNTINGDDGNFDYNDGDDSEDEE
jgi:translation initiation factor IF-1